MKKYIVAIILPFVTALAVSAQTYHNGTWYALYDDTEHTMNTQGDYETGVYAPTAGQLTVQWRYEWIDWLGAFAKIDTDVLESANGGSSTNTAGEFAENTSNGSTTTEHFGISRYINWIKYDRSGLPTHKVIVYHQDIPLAKHILLASGEYGATTASHDFELIDALSVSEPFRVSLRSFLTAGDITVSSSEPEIFRLGSPDNTENIVYAVGVNACASGNGKAAEAYGSNLGNIANYAFDVYFTPQEGKDYAAVIKLTDGVSTVTVAVTGSARKLQQTIQWEPETEVDMLGTIPSAVASSGLAVEYQFSQEGIVVYQADTFALLSPGEVTITAKQPGDAVYEAAEPVVRTINVLPAPTPPTTYGEYEGAFCEGDSVEFDGVWYFEATQADVLLSEKNRYGGDSIVHLTLSVHPVYHMEETQTIYAGDADSWQGIEIGQLPVGDTTLIVAYTSIEGCDSVYTLYLTVQPKIVTYGNDTIRLCAGESAVYEGKTYKRPTVDSVLVSEPNRYGGDSIVELVVYVFPSMKTTLSMTMEEGSENSWQDIDLSVLPAGDTTIVAAYTSVNGCDSVYVLNLTVTAVIHEGLEDVRGEKTAHKIIRGGQLYIRKGNAWYDLVGRKVEEVQ